MSEMRIAYGDLSRQIMQRPDSLPKAAAFDAVQAGAIYIRNYLAQNTPKGATGKARQLVTWDVVPDAHGIPMGQVYYAAPAGTYIGFVDQGTIAHWPPLEPLIVWAARKNMLPLDSPKAIAIARGVQRAIAARGVRAQYFVKKTVDERGAETAVIMREAAARSVARWRDTGA